MASRPRRTFTLQTPPFVGEIIGFGRYGRVGRLKDSDSKVFKFCAPDNQEAVATIEQEKKILGILGSHKFIIDLHWTCERGLCFEYYPSGSLRSYYGTLDPSLPEISDRIRWCHQAVAGVAYIHSKSIVHNDISPRNILITTSMDIKICDFGFSAMIGEEPTGGPELRYSRYRASTELGACVLDDLFSLGSLFHEIWTGKPPYEDIETDEIFRRFESHSFALSENVCPENFAEIIMKCWNERYETILDLQKDLVHG